MFSIRKLLLFFEVINISCVQAISATTALQEWYYELVNSDFKNFNELKQVYRNASIVADDRIVFNIMGNKFRLVVRIVFEFKAIQIKWFGTHAAYDKIDVTLIQHKRKDNGTKNN